MSSKKTELKRDLNLLDSTMINVGTIIGSGIFLVPTTIAQYLDASFWVILVWIIGGVITLFGALSMAELGAAMPRAGGQFVYLKKAYGEIWGYLYGWATFAVINTAAIAAITVAFATYLGYFVDLTALEIKVVAILSIAILTTINYFGVKSGARTQNAFTFVKVAAILGLIVVSFLLKGGSSQNFVPVLSDNTFTSLIGPFGLAMVAVLWSYDGWIHVTYVAGEIQKPQRNIPLSLLFSTLIVLGIYLMINLAYIYVLSLDKMAGSELVAADTAAAMLGRAGASLITVAVLVSTFGAANGFILAGARIYYAMAKEGVFFAPVAKVHPEYRTPAVSLIVQGAWSSLLVLSGTFNDLITYVVFASWIFYAMSCSAVLVLRKKAKDLDRPYKAWGYPITPLIFILFSAFLVGNTIIEDPKNALIGAGIVLLGLPLYFYFRK